MTDLFSDREWFAVIAKPGRHQFAVEQLERQGYQPYLPMGLVERTHARQTKTVARPLFGRYLFVGLHTEQPFGPICNTLGVDFVVRGAGGIPVRVSRLVLRCVLARCLADGGAVDLRPAPPAVGTLLDWEPGEPLEVIEGPFRDFTGALLEWADKRQDMARVMVWLFGRQTTVDVPVKGLRPLRQARAA